MIRTESIDHRDPEVAGRIHAILGLAHAQEAALLQLERFEAFDQTPVTISSSDQVFMGASRDGLLLGVLSLGPDDDPGQICISVLVVHPEHQRQGLARALLLDILDRYPDSVFSVVAAEGNQGAIALYQGLGFTAYRRGRLGASELAVVKLRSGPMLRNS
jgi:ribosomal protein S18 acetylase RimI-like enzyme